MLITAEFFNKLKNIKTYDIFYLDDELEENYEEFLFNRDIEYSNIYVYNENTDIISDVDTEHYPEHNEVLITVDEKDKILKIFKIKDRNV